jgi:hypothetical protein
MGQSKQRLPKSTLAGGNFVQLAPADPDQPRLPAGLRNAIDKGLTRLRQIRTAISAEAGLVMPPVIVHPVCWRYDDGFIYGKASPIQFDDGHYEWAAELPAPTALYVEDDVLRRILCHEYAHCFWYITECIRLREQGVTELTTAYDGGVGTESQEQSDKASLADPADWFGKTDAEQFMGDYNEPRLMATTDIIAERWVKSGRPTIYPDLRFAISENVIRKDHSSRAMSLLHAKASPRKVATATDGT